MNDSLDISAADLSWVNVNYGMDVSNSVTIGNKKTFIKSNKLVNKSALKTKTNLIDFKATVAAGNNIEYGKAISIFDFCVEDFTF